MNQSASIEQMRKSNEALARGEAVNRGKKPFPFSLMLFLFFQICLNLFQRLQQKFHVLFFFP